MLYVDAPEKEREGVKNDIVRQATRLLQMARDRNARRVTTATPTVK
jgi:hypothetical protein